MRTSPAVDDDAPGPADGPPAGGAAPPDDSAVERGRRRLWLYELVLVAFGYWLYSLVRNSVTTRESEAVGRAEQLVRLERTLHIYHEHAVNTFVASHHWLAYVCNYYYATLHFAVTIAVGVWVVWKHPYHARGLRTVWYSMNCVALLGFAFLALAPPRLLPGGGFADTVVQFHTWGSWGDSGVASHSNQYAAMPSMHIGWSTWVAFTLFKLARRKWVRGLAVLYPFATLFVIVGTANHYYLDAVGGLVALAGGYVVTRVILGRRVLEQEPFTDPLARRAAQRDDDAAELADEAALAAGGGERAVVEDALHEHRRRAGSTSAPPPS